MCSSEERYRCNIIRTTLIIVYTYILFVNGHNQKIRYILMWTTAHQFTNPSLQRGNKSFIANNCPHKNCLISNKFTGISQNITNYDAILFNAVTMRLKPSMKLPKKHAKNQKYILFSSQSAADFPLTNKYNNFFHWTWTYKLNSDISNAYIVIKNKYGKVIGPKQDMHWLNVNKMGRLETKIISKLQFKTTAAAWFVSNCNHKKRYKNYIQELKIELGKYNHTLDIFGPCGDKVCPEENIKKCYTLLESKYYFYFSFEDSIAEDYVTDQLLIALNHFAVPLVFGGANYSRFMPDGIYLDALEFGPTKLAKTMNDIIGNRKAYYDMFKWHNYYSFHSPSDDLDTNGICKLCKLLNDEERQRETNVYENIVKWFNDRKDWNFENEDVNVKTTYLMKNENFTKDLAQKEQDKKEPVFYVDRENIDQNIDKPKNREVYGNLETENRSLDNAYDRNGQVSPLLSDTFYEDKEDDFAEVQQVRNIVNNDLYNDINIGLARPSLEFGYENEEETFAAYKHDQNDDKIIYSTEKENLIDVIRRLEKEILKRTQSYNTTKVFNVQEAVFSDNDTQQISSVEVTTIKQQTTTTTTTNEQQQPTTEVQITTIKQNTDYVEVETTTENKILKDLLKRFEELVMSNSQQSNTRNNSEGEIYPYEFNYDDSQEDSLITPLDITTTGLNNNKEINKKKDFEYELKDIIRRLLKANTTKIWKNDAAEINNRANDNKKETTTKLHEKKSPTKIYDNITSTATYDKISSTKIYDENNYTNEQNTHKMFSILLWTNPKLSTFPSLKLGSILFSENRCLFQNCELSIKNSDDIVPTNYDAVLFDAIVLHTQPFLERPEQRAKHQKYVLVSRTSAAIYPIPRKYNNFFNWTWTYKLDSDIIFSDIVIKDNQGKMVGPAKDMHWIPLNEMQQTSKQIIRKLQSKTIAAAWIVTDCVAMNRHEFYIAKFRNELRKYNHILNIYGDCGNMKCPSDKILNCYSLLKTDYYFYMAFENSMAEDYVTDQLLTALNNFVVPLVFGGANYTRFMPDGIYLDALQLGAAKLARKINDLINDPKSYNDMFKWHNHYNYNNAHDDADSSGFCAFCALLNDNKRRKETTVYKNIVKWFNDRKDWNLRDHSLEMRPVYPINGTKSEAKKRAGAAFLKYHITTGAEFLRAADERRPFPWVTPGFNDGEVNIITMPPEPLNLNKRKYHSEQTTKSLEKQDTSIRCPDIVTCFNTIVSNVKSKVSSLLS